MQPLWMFVAFKSATLITQSYFGSPQFFHGEEKKSKFSTEFTNSGLTISEREGIWKIENK